MSATLARRYPSARELDQGDAGYGWLGYGLIALDSLVALPADAEEWRMSHGRRRARAA
ncbi:MAG TPA: hypothetical protein VGU02_06360 [Gaiellaceae bacterium]|nr:hypothetical protein [Gaiellaceae bacterium]